MNLQSKDLILLLLIAIASFAYGCGAPSDKPTTSTPTTIPVGVELIEFKMGSRVEFSSDSPQDYRIYDEDKRVFHPGDNLAFFALFMGFPSEEVRIELVSLPDSTVVAGRSFGFTSNDQNQLSRLKFDVEVTQMGHEHTVQNMVARLYVGENSREIYFIVEQ